MSIGLRNPECYGPAGIYALAALVMAGQAYAGETSFWIPLGFVAMPFAFTLIGLLVFSASEYLGRGKTEHALAAKELAALAASGTPDLARAEALASGLRDTDPGAVAALLPAAKTPGPLQGLCAGALARCANRKDRRVAAIFEGDVSVRTPRDVGCVAKWIADSSVDYAERRDRILRLLAPLTPALRAPALRHLIGMLEEPNDAEAALLAPYERELLALELRSPDGMAIQLTALRWLAHMRKE